ncbi:5-oxoprolinase [Drosophila guanche]|uniref:Blast:5-oxoprolinase n=1 Tax=Drosophila guanche TaxID=7266 RepID=A0A3B0J1Z4_DROGU|nr:5-oxoprolinase [Drosophila guanche]SPP75055.1 blast:5-oxoprolinase [Drosophila guanche]
MADPTSGNKYCFAIDRGGTFTDVLCICPGGKVRTMKLLSEDPERYSDAPREGIRRILKEETGQELAASGLVDTSKIGWVRMGTTVATNALLERKGDPVVLVVNSGFRDLLYIGNQARPKIFDLNIRKPANLYHSVVEVDCRIVPEQADRCELNHSWKVLEGVASTRYLEVQPVDVEAVRASLTAAREQGVSSVAVVLAHSYACPEHELEIGAIARQLGFSHVTLSHQAMPMCRVVARGYTACAEAYLTPHVDRYLASFKSGFDNQLDGVDVLFMQSDGGLTNMENFRGARAILSGPAGGVVGYALTGSRETKLPLIGFDMGGTSTDVSRYADSYEHVIESTTAGVTIQAPQLDINTVAAGGGSRLFFRSGIFVVGPESAGSHPGPACYKKGGPLTVTDANLILGRILPQYFPKIFGPTESEPLDYEISKSKFIQLQSEINSHLKATGDERHLSVEQVALGFIRVANETMCRPIRALTQSRGLDTANHVLSCFGGAGGQHACAIASNLGIAKVVVHKYAGILSAYGMALADVVQELQEPSGLEFSDGNGQQLKERLDALSQQCRAKLADQGFRRIELEPFLHLRYEGTDGALMCAPTGAKDSTAQSPLLSAYGDFHATFLERYRTEFGFVLQNRRIIVDDIRIRGMGKNETPPESEIKRSSEITPPAEGTSRIHFDQGSFDAPIYLTRNLLAGHQIAGPAVLIDQLSTIIVEPECGVQVTAFGDLIMDVKTGGKHGINAELDPVHLSIFSHRFMSIAEQMGRVLQRTSISTNIKERLDFSCALFGPDGGLVSNAPHIPVHLGAMQETVQYQLRVRGETLKNGDVILANHPSAGGSHLPDLTVITPVFYEGVSRPVFFVASRGHHADIGGITPGSMPPHSTSLAQEGAAFKSFLIVESGLFQEQQIIERLTTPTAAKGAVGTRNLSDNLSDLKAQIAANHKGIQLVSELIDSYGLNVVQAYMSHIQKNAELAVRDMLRQIGRDSLARTGSTVLQAQEFMDDGSPITLKVTIDAEQGSALCDFTGSGVEVWGNCNAPRAITLSALIYCLRCMVGHDVPLNQGCLAPIQVIIPKNSILDPSEGAAVVGGNVQTSQRIVDTVLKAFRVCGASQGCMNNITIGDETWGYYETVAGGAGAGPGWHGAGGVHTHMTNTRITDPEILELRYPMILKRFCLRTDGSGGRGQFNGGEGVERDLLFRKPVTLSVLTERRTLQPYGLAGGEPAKSGRNLIIKRDGRVIALAGKTCIDVDAGDTFAMKTPGGGGYGHRSDSSKTEGSSDQENDKRFVERGTVFNYLQAQESA